MQTAKTFEVTLFRVGDRIPVPGWPPVDRAFLDSLVRNFRGNVYGQDLPLNRDHSDETGDLLGWITDLRRTNGALRALVQPVSEEAREMALSGRARYVSPELLRDCNGHGPTLVGAAFVVRPAIKGQQEDTIVMSRPLKFQETDPAVPTSAPLAGEVAPPEGEESPDASEELARRLLELTGQIADLRAENDSLRARFEEQQKELEAARAQLREAQEALRAATTQNADLQERKESLSSQLDSLRNELSQRLTQYVLLSDKWARITTALGEKGIRQALEGRRSPELAEDEPVRLYERWQELRDTGRIQEARQFFRQHKEALLSVSRH